MDSHQSMNQGFRVSQSAFQRSLRWYVPILVVQVVVSYLQFFPVGQRSSTWWVSAAVGSVWALATVIYAVVCLRMIRTRKQLRN